MLLQNDKKTNKLRYYQTAVASILDKGGKVGKKKNPLYDCEKCLCALICFISLHYNIYSLRTLQRHAELQ